MTALDISHFYDAVASSGDVLPGAPFDPWRLRVLDAAAVAALSPVHRLAYLACWGLLAPTTHNTVPQRFELRPHDGSIALWIDRAAVLAESDPVGRQAVVSLGCVIENMRLAAASVALQATVELVPGSSAAIRPASEGEPARVHVATMQFSSDPTATATDWLVAMRQRKMVRAEFDDRIKLDRAREDELHAATRELHTGLTLHVLSDAPTRLFLGKFQELADSTVINRERFARELGDWLLPNDSQAYLGMRGHEFGLGDTAAARMHRGLLGLEPLLPDETAAFAKIGNLGMRSASAVAVITAAHDDLEHRVAAGRAFEQLALRLVRHGFVTAMHAGITEVEAPNLALRGRLRTRQRPTVVFRIGKPLRESDGQRPRSSRPHLLDVLMQPA